VIYEMHVGTFTPEGTWRSAMRELPALVELGITAIEIMPIADFPGDFGWGYDGVTSLRHRGCTARRTISVSSWTPRTRSVSAWCSTSSTTTSAQWAATGSLLAVLFSIAVERVGPRPQLRR
jgi:hypothetical protein